jgi:hypothetical protein
MNRIIRLNAIEINFHQNYPDYDSDQNRTVISPVRKSSIQASKDSTVVATVSALPKSPTNTHIAAAATVQVKIANRSWFTPIQALLNQPPSVIPYLVL